MAMMFNPDEMVKCSTLDFQVEPFEEPIFGDIFWDLPMPTIDVVQPSENTSENQDNTINYSPSVSEEIPPHGTTGNQAASQKPDLPPTRQRKRLVPNTSEYKFLYEMSEDDASSPEEKKKIAKAHYSRQYREKEKQGDEKLQAEIEELEEQNRQMAARIESLRKALGK